MDSTLTTACADFFWKAQFGQSPRHFVSLMVAGSTLYTYYTEKRSSRGA